MNQDLIADPKNSPPQAPEPQSQTQTENSESCSNCGTQLSGPYCHNCGQSSRSMIKFFGALFREVAEDVIGYDSRLRHTIFPLLMSPGKITNDYIRDRRFYYVLPLRLYLITSVLFILLLKFTTDTQGIIPVEENKAPTVAEKVVLDESQEKNAPSEQKATLLAGAEESREIDDVELIEDQNFGIQIEGDELAFKGKEFQEEGALKAFAEEIEKKWRVWKKDPTPLVKQVFELLPYMMFILLPIFALILKFFYCFSNRYYVEHLIFLIHNHSFLYVALMLNMGLAFLHETFMHSSSFVLSALAEVADWITQLMMVWMVVYIFLSMRRVYRQHWIITLAKGTLLGSIYFTMISLGFVTTLLIGAYLA